MIRRLIACATFLWPALAFAQQQPTPEQIKAMQAEMQAGPEHKVLAALAGRWSLEVTYNMGGPAAKSMTARGTATNRMILGGRFLSCESVSENPAGSALGNAKVEALTIYGFDRRTREYTVLGLDTMGTYWVSAAGRSTPDMGIVMSGETPDEHAGSREIRKYDMVLKVVDADTYVTQIIFKFANMPPLKLVEITHRRIK
jgi:hypothetical protein